MLERGKRDLLEGKDLVDVDVDASREHVFPWIAARVFGVS